MIYTYNCECNNSIDINLPIGTDLPKDVVCEKCGKIMKHDFLSKWKESNTTIIVPEKFKATSKLYDKQKYYGKFNVHEKQLY